LNNSRRLRFAILGSGRGSNAVALADACLAGEIAGTIVTVLSDVPAAGILERARERGIHADAFDPGPFRTKLADASEALVIRRLREARADYVLLAGFMRILRGEFLRAFSQRILNIHPSLLPSFPGLNAWQQALDHGVKITGCTVHVVNECIDGGPILGQAAVPVLDGDTAATLHSRIQKAEHGLYPSVVGALARGDISIEGRRARGFRAVPSIDFGP
jgi:phosphoribosylglycinamide formyltransferase-1